MKRLSLVLALVLVGGLGCSGKKETTKEGDKELTLTPPGNTSITQGTSGNAKVTIKRTKFDDPVDIEISGLPDKVTAEESKKTIGKDSTDTTFILKVDDKAPVVADGKEVTLTARTK